MLFIFITDLVWPGLLIATRFWWVIVVGLTIEWFFIYKICDVRLGKAFLINLAMNAVSGIMGIVLIPIAGLLWELSLMQTLAYHFFNFGTFSPLVWIMTVLLGALGNNFLEYYILSRFLTIKYSARVFGWLYIANVISVSVAIISLMLSPAG